MKQDAQTLKNHSRTKLKIIVQMRVEFSNRPDLLGEKTPVPKTKHRIVDTLLTTSCKGTHPAGLPFQNLPSPFFIVKIFAHTCPPMGYEREHSLVAQLAKDGLI